MNELTATYHQNTTSLPEAFRTMETGSKKSPGKINGCFFQGLDYYPYGMEMPGRTFTAQTYRYAYQGSEQAPEYNSAGGNVYTTFFRTLDSRLGRWHTPDVVSQPWQSPYCSMDNNPVVLVDPWGAQSEGGGDADVDGGMIEEVVKVGSPSSSKSSSSSGSPLITTGVGSGALDMQTNTNITNSFSQYTVSAQTNIINEEVAKKYFEEAVSAAYRAGETAKAEGGEYVVKASYTVNEIEDLDNATVEWEVELAIKNKKDAGVKDLITDVERSKPPGEKDEMSSDFASGAGIATTTVSQAASNAAHDLNKAKYAVRGQNFAKQASNLTKFARYTNILSGIIGFLDNRYEAKHDFSKGNTTRGTVQTVQAVTYATGVALLFVPIPGARVLGGGLILAASASDFFELITGR
jgi:RHS repeat-associated protein